MSSTYRHQMHCSQTTDQKNYHLFTSFHLQYMYIQWCIYIHQSILQYIYHCIYCIYASVYYSIYTTVQSLGIPQVYGVLFPVQSRSISCDV